MASIYLSGSSQYNNVGAGTYGTEAKQMQFLADKIKFYISQGKGNVTVFRNNANMSLHESINESNLKNPDLHLALHTNAGGGRGTEVYYSNYPILSSSSKNFAELIYNAVSPITIASDRGIHADTDLYENGLAECRETISTACLIEVMFHDNLSDVNDYLSKIDNIAKAIAVAVYKYFKISYKDDSIDYLEILKEVSLYWQTWDKFINSHPEVNLKGLIVKIKNHYSGGS